MDVLDVTPASGPAFPAGVRRVEYASGQDGLRDWALLWPQGSSRLWAVVLHGHGSHGDQLYTREDVRRAWLAPLQAMGLGLLTPNLRDNSWMNPAAAADLHALIEWLRAEWKGERFVFLSGSMGGTGNLIYSMLHPEDSAATVALGAVGDVAAYHAWCMANPLPILREIGQAIESAYGGPPDGAAAAYRSHDVLRHAGNLTMPLFLSHGEGDQLMPVSQARSLAAALAGSAAFRYREVPKGDHDSPLFLTEPTAWLAGVLEG
jgi:pimeloyl-ACP methyl ester carboxylesterase